MPGRFARGEHRLTRKRISGSEPVKNICRLENKGGWRTIIGAEKHQPAASFRCGGLQSLSFTNSRLLAGLCAVIADIAAEILRVAAGAGLFDGLALRRAGALGPRDRAQNRALNAESVGLRATLGVGSADGRSVRAAAI